jgi:hypothetical protein
MKRNVYEMLWKSMIQPQHDLIQTVPINSFLFAIKLI